MGDLPERGWGTDGRLAPGGTYTVNANELLAAANWAELSAGHVHVRTDYTHCNGVGLIYGTMGIDQSYTAIVTRPRHRNVTTTNKTAIPSVRAVNSLRFVVT